MERGVKMRYRISSVICVSVLLFGVGGCFSSSPEDIQAFARPQRVNVSADSYILQPPDEIEIHCSKVPEIHLQSQKIRPDGMVSFEALGEILAAGRTPEQLAEALKEKVSSLYSLVGDKPIDVRIVVYESNFYYVLGQVYYEGPKAATGRDTVLHALAAARPTVLAWTERVQVVRPSFDKNIAPKIFELNYDRMIAHGEADKNVLLEQGDIVFVPPTVLAVIGMKIEELVSPIGRAFSTVNIVEGPRY